MNAYSVLVVDDSEIDRYILKRMVEGVKPVEYVLEAENGKEAIEFLSDYSQRSQELKDVFPPVIIFLDINMPLINGFEFLEVFSKLRDTYQAYKNSRVVMYSSSGNDDDRSKAAEYRFVHDFVVKGENSIEQLQAKIYNIIEERS